MKYQKGDTVKIKKPQVYGPACDSTSSAKNAWTVDMDDMDGMEIQLDEHERCAGWRIVHRGGYWGLLEDWLQPVSVAVTQDEDNTTAYDRAMSIL